MMRLVMDMLIMSLYIQETDIYIFLEARYVE